MFNQGDIILIKFPFTDGSEYKKRPVLIISNNSIAKTEDFVVVQITSKKSKEKSLIEIVDRDLSTKLQLKSYVKAHKLFTVHKSLILSKIGTINKNFQEIVIYKISEILKVN